MVTSKKSAISAVIPIALATMVFAVISDQVTKWWALNNLVEGDTREILGSFLQLDLIRNPGAAFSMGEGSTWIFTVISVVVVIVILWYIISGRAKSRALAAILGLIAGGAIGNLIDRLTQPPGFGRGHVIDFLNYNGWFIGNVADIWIVGGAIVLVLYLLFTDNESREQSVDIGETMTSNE